MRKTLFFLATLSFNIAMAQIRDDFSDGDFTANPAWQGSTNMFFVNADKQLQSLLSNKAQTAYLVTQNNLAFNTKWEFLLQLNFDPSTTNFARIYLISDEQNLNADLNGYYLQVGESGITDSFDLYRQSGNKSVKIMDGPAKTRANANQLIARVRLTRDNHGKWEVYTDITGGTNYTLEGSVTDNTYLTGQWFGIFCKYTATRSDGFIFDDFNVEELVADVTPPVLEAAKALDANTIEAVFSEALNPVLATMADNYSLNQNYGSPNSVTTTAQANIYRLNYANTLTTNHYTLSVKNVQDVKGNPIAVGNTATFFYIRPYKALKGDVLINEIFADPIPSVGLPQAEFVELWNLTGEYILLKGWQYADAGSVYTFSTDTIVPNGYLILCPNANVNDYKPFGKTTGLTPWLNLNNDKDVLKLQDPFGTIIDQVAYANTWYKDELKKQGGYSLELIDPKNRCKGIQNWQASNAALGGTPGAQNTVYQSQYSGVAPKLLGVNITEDQTLILLFSKPVDSLMAAEPSCYRFNNGIGIASSAMPVGPLFTTVEVKFAGPLTRGIELTLLVVNVTDCAGNLIDPLANTAKIFLAKEIKPGNILISEVLLNPKASGSDYVEIYNNSDDILDLKDLLIAKADAVGNVANVCTVTVNSILIYPKTYWVLTANPAAVKNQYYAKYPSQFVQLKNMPGYYNASGTVILLSSNALIDRLDYNEKMHLTLLNDYKGVALERVSFKAPANQTGNFKSAAQTVGFGTPTYANSQSEEEIATSSQVYLSSKTFSPDGDGFEDFLIINYHLKNSGAIANITIYADNGKPVRKLKRNSTIATDGFEIWDGLDDEGKPSPIGIYIVKFDVFYLSGKKINFTKTCVLASRL